MEHALKLLFNKALSTGSCTRVHCLFQSLNERKNFYELFLRNDLFYSVNEAISDQPTVKIGCSVIFQ